MIPLLCRSLIPAILLLLLPTAPAAAGPGAGRMVHLFYTGDLHGHQEPCG
jgi:hypothetical protein